MLIYRPGSVSMCQVLLQIPNEIEMGGTMCLLFKSEATIPLSVLIYLDMAAMLDSDWVTLARQLGIGDREVLRIQLNNASMIEQARGVLRYWACWACSTSHPDPSELERALRYIGREDIIDKFFVETTATVEADREPVSVPASSVGKYDFEAPPTGFFCCD